jgi:heptosyltransferase-2
MKRLVILAPNWLGDAVMALPAIADVRRAAPVASIAVAARASVAPLFALVPEVNETIVLRRVPLSVAAWRELGAEIAGKGFDTALLLPNSVHAALLAGRAGIPNVWGYRTDWRGRLLTRAITPARGVHQVEYYQHLVHVLGFANRSSEPRVTVPTEAREAARALLVSSGWDHGVPLVAIAPGAAYGGAKRWPPPYFAELVDGLAADGVQCVMVGTAADAETGAAVERSAHASRSIVNLVGRTDLSTLAGVVANCRALVTNDSGAMHLAAAIGIPVTAMFGPTSESATSPRTPNPDPRIGNPDSRTTILTHPVWCRPCMLRECPLDHGCMRGIRVATVLEAARSRL